MNTCRFLKESVCINIARCVNIADFVRKRGYRYHFRDLLRVEYGMSFIIASFIYLFCLYLLMKVKACFDSFTKVCNTFDTAKSSWRLSMHPTAHSIWEEVKTVKRHCDETCKSRCDSVQLPSRRDFKVMSVTDFITCKSFATQEARDAPRFCRDSISFRLANLMFALSLIGPLLMFVKFIISTMPSSSIALRFLSLSSIDCHFARKQRLEMWNRC